MKSMAKKTVAEYKKELAKTGGSSNAAATPSELQFKIASFIGLVYAKSMPGTENCDMAGNSSISDPSSKTITTSSLLGVGVIGQSFTENEPISVASLSSDKRSLKRSKLSRRELQDEKIVQAEQEIKSAVIQIKDEFRSTNAILLDLTKEIKRGNDIQLRLVEIIERQQQTHRNYFNISELNYNTNS